MPWKPISISPTGVGRAATISRCLSALEKRWTCHNGSVLGQILGLQLVWLPLFDKTESVLDTEERTLRVRIVPTSAMYLVSSR